VTAAPTGVCLPHRRCSAASAIVLAQRAEALGYDSVWVSELATYDAVAVAAAIAMVTERVRVGLAIIPVTTRTPALHAMSLSTLGSLLPERAIVGYGVSTAEVIERWHGQDISGPVALTRDLFDIVDQALTGERTDHAGVRQHSHGFRLEGPAPSPPRRYLGALGPRMRRLARERADGLILNFAPRSRLAEIARSEQPRPSFEVALPLRVAVQPSEQDVTRFRRELASYLRVAPYAAAMRDFGMGAVVDRASAVDSLAEMAAALPDEFVADMWTAGDVAACREQLDRVRDDGVTPLLVQIVAPGDVAAFDAIISALA
jgi:probable F420-dependent oxidoreductase